MIIISAESLKYEGKNLNILYLECESEKGKEIIKYDNILDGFT